MLRIRAGQISTMPSIILGDCFNRPTAYDPACALLNKHSACPAAVLRIKVPAIDRYPHIHNPYDGLVAVCYRGESSLLPNL